MESFSESILSTILLLSSKDSSNIIILPSAIETEEKWNIPINRPSAIFKTKLPLNPRKFADDYIVVPDGTSMTYSSLYTIFFYAKLIVHPLIILALKID